jgi:hypothetical protein
VVLWLACLALDPRFAGSNLAEDNGTFKGDGIPVALHSHVIWGLNNRPIGGRSSET